MIRRLFKSGPKYVIAAAIVIASLAGFGLWLVFRDPQPQVGATRLGEAAKVGTDVAKIEARIATSILVDNDLYDVETGKKLAENWLKYPLPAKLFWQAPEKKILAQYERGFVRYNLDGSVDAELPNVPMATVADDYKWTVFSRGGDVYRSEIDWAGMKLTNERKVTSTGQFNDQSFPGNLVIGTDRTLILRQMNKVVSVNFETGAVKPMDLSLPNIEKRKSPDSKWIVGLEKGQFYCYDVDTGKADMHPVGRGAINDYQWLGNDKCVAIAAMKTIIVYDRLKKTLTELVTLPSPCNRIGEPSPDGHIVFCANKNMGVLVDVKKKTATAVTAGASVRWISNEGFIFSREILDSEAHGTWVQKVGEAEKRVLSEPFLIGRTRELMISVPICDVIVLATKKGLSKMKLDGTEASEIVKMLRPPRQWVGIEKWSY